MQMVRICVCQAYADVGHMDMLNLYIVLSFSAEIRKKLVPDLPVVIRPRPTLHHNMQWLSKLQELPDVVFLPSPVTRPPAAENCGMIILWA